MSKYQIKFIYRLLEHHSAQSLQFKWQGRDRINRENMESRKELGFSIDRFNFLRNAFYSQSATPANVDSVASKVILS